MFFVSGSGPPRALHLFPYTTLFRSLSELWHWTGDKNLIRPLLEPALRALRWKDKYTDLRARNAGSSRGRSEEHTSELQSHSDLVCRLLLEKKKTNKSTNAPSQPWYRQL